MFTGPEGPVEDFFTGPKPFWGIYTGLAGSLLASSPDVRVDRVSKSHLKQKFKGFHCVRLLSYIEVPLSCTGNILQQKFSLNLNSF